MSTSKKQTMDLKRSSTKKSRKEILSNYIYATKESIRRNKITRESSVKKKEDTELTL